MAFEQMNLNVIIIAERNPPDGQHRGRFNAQMVNEVSEVMGCMSYTPLLRAAGKGQVEVVV